MQKEELGGSESVADQRETWAGQREWGAGATVTKPGSWPSISPSGETPKCQADFEVFLKNASSWARGSHAKLVASRKQKEERQPCCSHYERHGALCPFTLHTLGNSMWREICSMDDRKKEKTHVPWKIFTTRNFENPLLSRIGWEGLSFHRKLHYVHFVYDVIQMFNDYDGV